MTRKRLVIPRVGRWVLLGTTYTILITDISNGTVTWDGMRQKGIKTDSVEVTRRLNSEEWFFVGDKQVSGM